MRGDRECIEATSITAALQHHSHKTYRARRDVYDSDNDNDDDDNNHRETIDHFISTNWTTWRIFILFIINITK